ncbi:MAG TPA: alkaline phosphatase family protein [Longimicrobium sp.]
MLELFVEGGEKQLRAPLRPIGGETRVLVFAFDGVGDDDLRRAVRTGAMPSVAAILGAPGGADEYAHAFAAPNAMSVLPTITVAAWTSLFTGRPPGQTGVPGNEWFVREEMRFYAPVPGSFRSNDHAIRMYTEGLVGRAVRGPTLFEQLNVRAHVSMLPMHRGADLLHMPKLNTLGDLFAETVESAVQGQPTRKSYSEMDQNAVRSVVAGLREHGAPDLQVVYFPGVDLHTHVVDNPVEGQQRYLRRIIDPLIGDVMAEYRRQGVADRTFVVFVSDHGHTPVLGDDRHALGDEPADLLREAGFRVRPFGIDAREDDFQAVLAYQGSMAFVYLADRSTCAAAGTRCAWRRGPRWTQDVLPVVRAFDRANRTGEGAPEMRGTLDLILARRPARFWQRGARPFEVWDGTRLVPIPEYLRRTPRPDLLRFDERMRELATGPAGGRAGDVLLLARSGSAQPIEERFYFGDEGYTSWHGSPSAQDSRIPLVVAHPARSGAELRRMLHPLLGPTPSQVEFAHLVRALFRQ